MDKEFIGKDKDSVTVQASIQIGKREIAIGANIPKKVFYTMFADLCEAVLESMLDDGLREDAEQAAEIAEIIREAEE